MKLMPTLNKVQIEPVVVKKANEFKIVIQDSKEMDQEDEKQNIDQNQNQSTFNNTAKQDNQKQLVITMDAYYKDLNKQIMVNSLVNRMDRQQRGGVDKITRDNFDEFIKSFNSLNQFKGLNMIERQKFIETIDHRFKEIKFKDRKANKVQI